ncbi:hypothetical protein BN1708_004616, partial [Verticillium longisporum]
MSKPDDLSAMEYRFLGRSGLQVSAISLGGWLTYGGHVDKEGTFKCMKAAYDCGVNFFDTAEGYAEGESEKVMGEAIKKYGWKRNDLVISTKIYWGGAFGDNVVNNKGLSRKHIIEGLDASLARLDLPYVDLVYAHRPDRHTPMEETVRAFNHVINEGKALYWGTSEWSADEIAQAWRYADKLNLIGPVMEQPAYNALDRKKVELDFVHLYREVGLGLTVFSPMRQGILSGKYKNGIPDDSRFAQKDVGFIGDYWKKENAKAEFQALSTAFLSSSPLPPRPQLSPLKETNTAGNRGAHEAKLSHEKHSDYSIKVEEKAWDLGDDSNVPEPSSHRFRLPRSPLKAMRAVTPEIEEKPRTASAASDASMDELALDQPPSAPPSPSPLPTERTRDLRKPPKVVVQNKPDTKAEPPAKSAPSRTNGRRRIVSDKSVDENLPPAPAIQQTPRTRRDISPRHVSSRLPLPRPANPPPQQSPLTMATIAAKLAASEREADAARVRAKLKAARGNKRSAGAISASSAPAELQPPSTATGAAESDQHQPPTIAEVPGNEDVDPVKRSVQGRDEEQPLPQPLPKRKRDRRVSKVASRRRSTLNPFEMESLISGNLGAPSPGA